MNSDFLKIGVVNSDNTVLGSQQNKTVTNPIGATNQRRSVMSSDVSSAIRATVLGGLNFTTKFRLTQLQKTFQDVFMNPNISLGEAKVMADRYKEIEKIADLDEYIKALFEEAKSNYGFEKSNIKLEILNSEEMPRAYGHSDNAFLSIAINRNTPRSHIINTIHHEFRHMKQNQIAYSYSPEKYMEAINKKCAIISDGKAPHAWSDLNKFTQWLDENLGGVRAEYIDENFAKNVLAGIGDYKDSNTNYDGYWYSFVEKDARKAGALIEMAIRNY